MSKSVKPDLFQRILWGVIIPLGVLTVGCYLLWLAAATWVLCWPLALFAGLFGFIFGGVGLAILLDVISAGGP